MGITQFAKKNAVKSKKKKGLTRFMSYRLAFPLSPHGVSLSPPRDDIAHFEKHCSRYFDVVTPTTTVMQAQLAYVTVFWLFVRTIKATKI